MASMLIPSQQDPKPQPTPEAQPNASSSSSAAPPKPILKRKAPKVTFEEEAPPQKKMKIPAFEFPVSKFNWHTEDKPSLGDIFGHDFGEQAPSTPFHLEAEVEAELDAEHTDDILVLDSEQEHTEPTPEPTPEIIYEKVDKKTAGFDTRRGAWWKADYGIRQYATEFKTEGNTVFAVFRNTQKNKTHLVPVPGLDASELEVFENGIQAKYKHTPAGEQKKHEVLFQGAFRHTHTHTQKFRRPSHRPPEGPLSRHIIFIHFDFERIDRGSKAHCGVTIDIFGFEFPSGSCGGTRGLGNAWNASVYSRRVWKRSDPLLE